MAANTMNQGPRLPAPQFQGPAARTGVSYGAENMDVTKGVSLNDQRIALFGTPNKNFTNDEYHNFDIENQILPDDWKKTAERHIAKVVIQKLEESDLFYVRKMLPFTEFGGGNVVKMSRVIFNSHLLDEVPEQGVPRFVTNTYEQWSQALPRYGIGFLMENGFLMTPTGIMHYALSIEQITNATLNTACCQVIYSILNVKSADNWFDQFGIPPNKRQLKHLFSYETQMWGILAKRDGFARLQYLAEEIISYRDVEPDYLIVSKGTIRDYQMLPLHQEEMDYNVAGPNGPKERRARGPIPALAKYNIFEAKKFQVGEHAMPQDLLEAVRSIGDMIIFTHAGHLDINIQDYRTKHMDVTVLDHEGDRMSIVSFRDHIMSSPLFYGNGELSTEVGEPFFRQAAPDGTFGEFVRNSGQEKRFFDSVGKFAAQTYPFLSAAERAKVDAIFTTADRTTAVAKAMRTRTNPQVDKVQKLINDILSDLHSTGPSSVDTGKAAELLADLKENYDDHDARTTRALEWLEAYRQDTDIKIDTCPAELRPAVFLVLGEENQDVRTVKPFFDSLATDATFAGGWLSDLFTEANRSLSSGRKTLFNDALANSQALNPLAPRTAGGYTSTLHKTAGAITDPALRKFHRDTHGEIVRLILAWDQDSKQSLEHILALAAVVFNAVGDHLIAKKNLTRNALCTGFKNAIVAKVTELRKEGKKGDREQMVREAELAICDGLSSAAVLVEFAKQLESKGTEKATECWEEAMKFSALAKSAGAAAGDWGKKFDLFPIALLKRDFFELMLDYDIWFPFHGLSVRPHIEWIMTTGILMKIGSETGSTYRGYPNFLLSVDGSRKMLMGNFTLYMGCIIKEPANILLLHNIGCRDYVRGGGVEHWEPFSKKQKSSYERGVIPGQEAFFSVPLYANEKFNADFIDITGRFPIEQRALDNDDTEVLHYRMADHVSAVFGWRQEDEKVYMDLGFREKSSYRNTRCAFAHQYHYKVEAGDKADARGHETLGTGHWTFSYDGCVKDRVGKGDNFTLLNRPEPRVSTLAF